uniref:Reverse transcriptase Ty1/copia-type domain-containing protein n=1 Tax=Cajanus cajan TaxID=3821 RepID=A0A151SPB7_CAJCA|nr:hypothetical protein KK1_002877 [Cajanus cajan]
MVQSKGVYPISAQLSYDALSTTHKAYALSLSITTEPTSFLEANKQQCWKDAMVVELKALEDNGTWIIVDRPPDVTPVGNKWVYKIKRHSDGTIERYKAQLVAKGYTQTEGIDLVLQWLSFLLADLRVVPTKSAVLFCDNKSALHIAANPIFHERTKHLEIDCHVVRERLHSGLMRLLPLPSSDQTADIFTKALLPSVFRKMISKLGMLDIYHPSLVGGG